MKRRSFLRIVGGAAGASTLGLEKLFADFRTTDDIVGRVAGLPRRVLGRTRREVSIIGFPGLALMRTDQEAANRAVKEAFERGVNYYDNAPAYGKDGECEIRMGPALAQLDRSKLFVSCKTKARDAAGARQELERSLERHRTDHFDLYQMHHLVTLDEVKRAFGPGGAIETFRKAREEGKIRAIGFSAHSTKAAVAALEAFEFDTAMFPISFADYYLRDFGKKVLDAAEARGAAVIAIKPMSMGAWPPGVPRTRDWWYRTTETVEEISVALRFSLSLKGVVAGIPPSFVELLERAVVAARDFRPATAGDRNQLRDLAKQCEALFLREDNKPEPTDTAQVDDFPYPHHVHECMG
jgi:predicted aldo/keto reductase-like oxidoreductase